MRKIIFWLLFFSISASAAEFKPDQRTQLPASLNQTYFGMGVDYTNIPFSNKNLMNGFSAASFTNPDVGLNVFIGHFFNQYIAAQISLMRPIQWTYANQVSGDGKRHSIWISVFGIAMRPTLPLSEKFSLYGIEGVGIVSRHGFSVGTPDVVAIPSADLMTPLVGGGITYAITPYWHLDTGLQYAVARPSEHQPHVLYAFGGFYYVFHTLHIPNFYKTQYIVHKNFIQVGSFSTDVFNPDINKYFTIHYLPIFWGGDVKTKNGGWVVYERNIFHTHKLFSLDLGASAATYQSAISDQSFQAFSIFPVFRLWFWRSPRVDFYFTYTVAGPAVLTRTHIDGTYVGGNFTFQDLMGVGAFIGKNKHFNVNAKIGHYSNGNLLTNNPGIEVPLVISMGYAF